MFRRICARSIVVFSLSAVACSDEPPSLGTPDKEVCLMRRDGTPYCIDVYEASREDAAIDGPGTDNASPPRSLENRLPWTDIDWAGAKAACEAKGKRLCELDEWIDGCDGEVGPGGRKYTYGDEIDAARCNTNTAAPKPSGSIPSCKSPVGTFDQSGNVREWTGNTQAGAVALGGSFRSSATHECNPATTMSFQKGMEVGFRCCRTRF